MRAHASRPRSPLNLGETRLQHFRLNDLRRSGAQSQCPSSPSKAGPLSQRRELGMSSSAVPRYGRRMVLRPRRKCKKRRPHHRKPARPVAKGTLALRCQLSAFSTRLPDGPMERDKLFADLNCTPGDLFSGSFLDIEDKCDAVQRVNPPAKEDPPPSRPPPAFLRSRLRRERRAEPFQCWPKMSPQDPSTTSSR